MISMVLRKLPLPAKKNTLSSTGNLRAKRRRRRRNRSRGGSAGSASPFHLVVCRHFLLIFLLFLSFGAAANSYIAQKHTHKDIIVCVSWCPLLGETGIFVAAENWQSTSCNYRLEHAQHNWQNTHFLNHTQRIIPYTHTDTLLDTHSQTHTRHTLLLEYTRTHPWAIRGSPNNEG